MVSSYNQIILVLTVAESHTGRTTTVKCWANFDGDKLLDLIIAFPSKLFALPRQLEDKYYTSSQAAMISDKYFYLLKIIMDRVGISNFLIQRTNGFLNLLPALVGILVFLAIVLKRPDFTLLTKIFFVSNPHLYSAIIAFNAILYSEVIKKSVDLSATSLNVLTGIWSTDFFSKRQTWALTEKVLTNVKLTAKVVVLAAVEGSEDIQRHLRVHNRLLKPLESYFCPAEVEKMDLIPTEFSYSDMGILSDKLNEWDQSPPPLALEGSIPIQTLLFSLVCKELKPQFEKNISSNNKVQTKKDPITKKFSKRKLVLKILAYRSPTFRPLVKAKRIVTSSCNLVNFVKISYRRKIIEEKNLNVAYIQKCYNSKNLK